MRPWPHRGRPPAGSLYARAVIQVADGTSDTPRLLLEDGSLLLDLPDVQLPMLPDPLSMLPISETLQMPEPSPLFSGSTGLSGAAASPIPAVTEILNSASPVMIAPPLSPTASTTPSAAASPSEALSSTGIAGSAVIPIVQTTTPAARHQQNPSATINIASRFTTIVLRPQATAPALHSSSSTSSTLGLFPSSGFSFSVLSAFVGTSAISSTSTSSISIPTASIASSSSVTMSAISTYMPSATSSSNADRPGGHPALFWVGIVIGALMGLILLLLGVLFVFKFVASRRTRQLWADDFFNPKQSSSSSGGGSETNEKRAVTTESDASEPLPLPLALATSSDMPNTGLHPSSALAGESERDPTIPSSLLVSEFDGMRSLAPLQSLRIANHVRGDLSSDEHSMATPHMLLPGVANEDQLGTPRTLRAAPFLRDSLRDGGLPVPWSTSDSDPVEQQQHLAIPFDRSHLDPTDPTDSKDLSRRASAVSHLSDRWWDDDERPASTLPAEGWAATLRSNLYATLSAWSGQETGSDPGAGTTLTQQPSRARSARSKASLHYVHDGEGLYRSDSEASKYSQLSAALTNPFVDPVSSTLDPSLPSHSRRNSHIPLSASMIRQPWQQHTGLGLGIAPFKGGWPTTSTYLQVPPRAASAQLPRMPSLSAPFIDVKSNLELPDRGSSQDRVSRIEMWRTRNHDLADTESSRTLWPSAFSRRQFPQESLGERKTGSVQPRNGNASRRLPSERPFLRRRGSSRSRNIDDGYASADR